MNKYNKTSKKLQTPETQTGTLYYSCVYDELAVKIGLNEALFLYKLHVLCFQSRNIKDNYQWVYNSAAEWKEKYFPYRGVNTVRRIITNLQKLNLIVICEYNKKSYDKSSWFRVNYGELQLLVPSIV